MALELSMIGLVVQDMGRSVKFYRRLGVAIPEGSEAQPHVEIKMDSGLTLFLDSRIEACSDPLLLRGASRAHRGSP